MYLSINYAKDDRLVLYVRKGWVVSVKRHPLRVERELRGWSQARVAEKVGTSTRTIVRWELGDALPQPYYRERLCALFGKNALELGLQPPLEQTDHFEEPLPLQEQAFKSHTM